MKISTRYDSAAFKSCGHTVIIVKTALPEPIGESAFCERIRHFYGELRGRYFSSAEVMAREHGALLWEENRRPLLFLVSFEQIDAQKTKKHRKMRNGCAFLRIERLSGMKKGSRKSLIEDFFFYDSGLLFG